MAKDHNLPSAIRWYLRSTVGSLMGDDQSKFSFSEKDMTEAELEAVKVAIQNARADGRSYISYEDYPTKNDKWTYKKSLLAEVDEIMTDPARSAMLTLGMASFDENGKITDSYDFAAPPDEKITASRTLRIIPELMKSDNPRSVMNFIGNLAGLRSGTGRQVSINTGLKGKVAKVEKPDWDQIAAEIRSREPQIKEVYPSIRNPRPLAWVVDDINRSKADQRKWIDSRK